MAGETLDVKWDMYSSHWLEALRDLKDTNFLSDVSILCEDNTRFEVHKLVLSSCSSVLRNIIELLPAVNSVLYFHGINGNTMNSLLEFMYQGRTISRQEDLKDFIEVANRFSLTGVALNNLTIPLLDQKKDYSREQMLTKKETENSILNEFEQLVSEEKCNLATSLHEPEPQVNTIKKEPFFPCTLCKYKATQQGHLKNHVKAVHERIKDICEECNKEFADRSNLKKHIRVVHEKVRYKCDKCNKDFKHQPALSSHMRSLHEGVIKDKKHECDLCGEKYMSTQALKLHNESKHLGIKYTCEKCGKKFSSRSTQVMHEKHFCHNL